MTHRDLADQANVCYCENQVFYSFTNNKTTILDTKLKRFHRGFFELEMLEIFTRAVLIKNYYWNLKLSIVALSSVKKCSP